MTDVAARCGTLAPNPESTSAVRSHQHHLLCVDDEKVLVLLTAEILATQGYRVTALCNPLEAVEVCHRENIELAVLDYQMPEMTGTRLAARLKNTRSKVKVVLFTGELQVPASELSPVDAVVSKSDGVDVLVATVNSLFAAP